MNVTSLPSRPPFTSYLIHTIPWMATPPHTHTHAGARLWRRLAPASRLPVSATWLMALLAALLAVPCIYNDLLFATISAGSVVALSLSYGG